MDDLSIIHDRIRSLMHKKCHPKRDHSGIKYYMTLNIISSVFKIPMFDSKLRLQMHKNGFGSPSLLIFSENAATHQKF